MASKFNERVYEREILGSGIRLDTIKYWKQHHNECSEMNIIIWNLQKTLHTSPWLTSYEVYF